MKKICIILAIFVGVLALASLKNGIGTEPFKQLYGYTISELRQRYSSGDTDQWPKAEIDSAVTGFQELGILPEVTFPRENPYSEAKRTLGKMLFYDPALSGSGQIACANCHDPELGWGDGRRVSFGHDRIPGARNSRSIINAAFAQPLFWDGRAATLEEQAKFPILDQKEMNNHMNLATETINHITGYRVYFKDAFGDTVISEARILKAIATFERTVVSRKSRFDYFIAGDSTKLTDQEVLGLHLFRTKARCANCHNSPYFSDNQFHNAGLTYYGRKFEDLGRYQVTHNPEDVGKFRTPSLREVGKTAPYMHNGLFPHLRGVLNMYNAGMPHNKPKTDQLEDPLFPTTSPLLKQLNLTEEELQALEAFLGSITSVIYREPAPEVPVSVQENR